MGTITVEAELAAIHRRLQELDDRLAAAERSLDGQTGDDQPALVAALGRELHELDASLEWLQAGAVEATWRARQGAEAAIATVRDRRIALGQRLSDLSTNVNRKEQKQ